MSCYKGKKGYSFKPGEKIFNDSWNPMFIKENSVSVWLLIIDGVPTERFEFLSTPSDEYIKTLSDSAYDFYIEKG